MARRALLSHHTPPGRRNERQSLYWRCGKRPACPITVNRTRAALRPHPYSEKAAIGLTQVVPFLVEDMLKENGHLFESSRLAPTRGRRWQSDHWPEPGLSARRRKGRPATTGRRCCAEQGAPGVDGCCCGRRSSPPSVTGAVAQTVDSALSDWNNSEIGESWRPRSASYRDRFFSLKTPLGPNT